MACADVRMVLGEGEPRVIKAKETDGLLLEKETEGGLIRKTARVAASEGESITGVWSTA